MQSFYYQVIVVSAVILLLFPSTCNCIELDDCSPDKPGYNGTLGHYTWEKGTPPKTDDGHINPCVKPGYNNTGYFIWRHGYLKNNHSRKFEYLQSCMQNRFENEDGFYLSSLFFYKKKCVFMAPRGLFYWNHASFLGDTPYRRRWDVDEYCTDFEPGYDGSLGHYKWHSGTPPKDPCVKSVRNGGGYYIWHHGSIKDNHTYYTDDKLGYTAVGHCAQISFKRNGDDKGEKYGFYESNRGPHPKDACVLYGPHGSVGYYVWHHPSHIKDLIVPKVVTIKPDLLYLVRPQDEKPEHILDELVPPESKVMGSTTPPEAYFCPRQASTRKKFLSRGFFTTQRRVQKTNYPR
ncbi:uncharacterized protein ACN427_002169 [Glossina fuscipes fuscipes]